MASEAVRPWFCRFVEAIPAAPVGAAALIAGVIGAAELIALALSHGLSNTPIVLDVRLLVFPAAIAYFVCGGWFVVEGWERDVAALRPSLAGPREECARLAHALTHHSRGRLVAATLSGPLIPVALDLVSPGAGGPMSQLLAGEPLGFEAAYGILEQVLFWMVVLPVLYTAGVVVHRLWRCGRHQVKVDLLDLDALAPFGRFGLRLALFVLAIPVLLIPAFALGYTVVTVEVLLYAPILLLGLAALVVPSWGAHSAIRAAKTQELERLRRAIHGDRSALAESSLAAHADELSFVDLLAYRNEIRSLREWPFDARAVQRFGLYLLIPLASWVAGALVERAVDLLLE
jgi:hypothetical protein